MAKDSDDSSKDIIDRGVKNSDDAKEAKKGWKYYSPLFEILSIFILITVLPFLNNTFGNGKPDGHLTIALLLFGCWALVGIYKMSARAGHRFSINSLFYLTTLISIYAGIYASLGEEGLLISYGLGVLMVMAQAVFLVSNFIVCNLLFFTGALGNSRTGEIKIVRIRWYWPSHLFVAFLIFVVWAIGTWIDVLTPSARCFFVATLAIMGHVFAVRRSSITVYSEGVEFVGKIWRWEDGQLVLFQEEGITRLGPSWVHHEKRWKRRLWPMVPDEKVEELKAALNRHRMLEPLETVNQ